SIQPHTAHCRGSFVTLSRYRIAGLISREQKDLAVEINEAEIRSAQHRGAARGREAGVERGADRDRSASFATGRSESSGRSRDDPGQVVHGHFSDESKLILLDSPENYVGRRPLVISEHTHPGAKSR